MKSASVKLLFLAIVFFLLTISILTFKNLNAYTEEVKSIRHSGRVLSTLEIVLSTIKDAETGHRGYQLTRDTIYLQPYYYSVKTLPRELKILDSLASADDLQSSRVDTLQQLTNNQFAVISQILSNAQRSTLYMDRYESDLLLQGKKNMNDIRNVAKRIRDSEEAVFNERISNEASFKNIAPISLFFYGLVPLVGIVFLFTRVLDGLEKRRSAEDNLKENIQALRAEVGIREFTQRTLRSVLDNSWDGIMVFRSIRNALHEVVDFEWILTNTVSLKSYDYAQDNLVGKRLLDIRPDLKLSGIFEIYKRVVETGKANQFEQHYDINGVDVWYNVTAVKFEDGFIVTFADITERKLYENKLTLYTTELQRSNQELEQFAYVASHDLQEPLRKIRAFGDRLSIKYGDVLTGPGLEYIQRMQQSAARMQRLIEDLLTFSRVSHNVANFERLEMSRLLEEVLDDLDAQVKRERAAVQIGEVPAISGDRVQIKRLFQNLISNGIKFHKENETPRVEISGKIMKSSEVLSEYGIVLPTRIYSCIVVKDHGIGFDEQYADRIFHIFQRLHGRTAYEGTGIGLSICRKIVTNHKGSITCRSKENVGSEFIVILPIQ